ncbi:MAG: energy-coupling factor transporter ATPase [Bacillota bacterium]|nr:energy-coupling factor transporter ATPase [Bacillota bacterium]
MREIIKTEQLRFSYQSPETVLALKDLSITIPEGQFVAVLGHNGSGKSTLAKHMNAILLPSGGACYIAGMDTRDKSLIYDIRRTAGMVFQNPDNQIVATVVEEDVAFAPENMGLPQKEIRRRVDEALLSVGMQDYKQSAPYHLSGGQKQRVAIAGVIAMRPRCIILDEPTAMLDPIGRDEILSTIKSLNKNHGITIILITHNMNEAAEADRILVLSKGSLLIDGTPKEVFENVETMKSAGLSVPQTVELLYELKKLGCPVSLDGLRVNECADILYRFLEA